MIGRERYQRYLASSAWAAKRVEAFNFYGRACLACGDPAHEVHHRCYDRLGAEAVEDLRVLCEMCHLTVHSLMEGLHWNWLARITDDVVQGRHLEAGYRPGLSRRRRSGPADSAKESSPSRSDPVAIPKSPPRQGRQKGPAQPKKLSAAERASLHARQAASLVAADENGFVPRHLRGARVIDGKVRRATF